MRKFINNANTVKNFKGNFIIGSIHKQNGQVSVSPNPSAHDTRAEADAEAARLATTMPDKKFLILQVVGIASTQNVVFE